MNLPDIEKIKKDFPIFKEHRNLVYLDNAASSQTPQCVLDAMNKYYISYRANIHRGMYSASEKATLEYERSRKVLADFIGAGKEEIIFTSGATGSANMLAYCLEHSFDFKEGDEIITTIAEHHSNLVPLQELAHRKKMNIKCIPVDDSYNLDYKEAEKLITKKTKIVAIAHASNVLGTINDIEKIARLAHDVGALVIIDASKTAGHININVRELDADFLFFSGHKMCGPTGIGVLFGKKKHLEIMTPGFFGGGMVTDVCTTVAKWRETPLKFEAGTPNISGAVGLAEAVEYIKAIGLESIHKHESRLISYAIEKLGALPFVSIVCQKDPQKNTGVLSFSVNGIHGHDISEILARENIAVRSGLHCAEPLMHSLGISNLTRASIYMYNYKKDIDLLVQGVKKAYNIFYSK